VHIIHRSRYFL